MAVIAKFRVTGRREYTQGGHSKELEGVELHMQPVFGQDEGDPNKEWSKWTPSGELRMSVTNPAAYEQFSVGQDVMLTLEPVPKKG